MVLISSSHSLAFAREEWKESRPWRRLSSSSLNQAFFKEVCPRPKERAISQLHSTLLKLLFDPRLSFANGHGGFDYWEIGIDKRKVTLRQGRLRTKDRENWTRRVGPGMRLFWAWFGINGCYALRSRLVGWVSSRLEGLKALNFHSLARTIGLVVPLIAEARIIIN